MFLRDLTLSTSSCRQAIPNEMIIIRWQQINISLISKNLLIQHVLSTKLVLGTKQWIKPCPCLDHRMTNHPRLLRTGGFPGMQDLKCLNWKVPGKPGWSGCSYFLFPPFGSPARSLSILLVFSKNQFLVYWFFPIFLVFSIPWIFTFIFSSLFMIALGLFCSSFLVP